MGQMVGNLFGLTGGSVVMDQTGPLAVVVVIASLLTVGLFTHPGDHCAAI
jgi:hypothetical protein